MKSQVKNVEILYETRFLNMYKMTYLDKNGKEKVWLSASKKK